MAGERQATPERGPGGRFKKGQSGNPTGLPKSVEPVFDQEPIPDPPVPDGEPDPPAVLRDLRWAYRNFGVRCDGTPQQMAFREMLEADRPKFMDLLTKHEQMHEARIKRAAQGGGDSSSSEAATSAVDEGTEKALRILDEWLSDPSNWGE